MIEESLGGLDVVGTRDPAATKKARGVAHLWRLSHEGRPA